MKIKGEKKVLSETRNGKKVNNSAVCLDTGREI